MFILFCTAIVKKEVFELIILFVRSCFELVWLCDKNLLINSNLKDICMYVKISSYAACRVNINYILFYMKFRIFKDDKLVCKFIYFKNYVGLMRYDEKK